MNSDLIEALARLDDVAERHVSLAPFCTYRVGGSAAGLVRVDDVATLERVHDGLTGLDVPVLVIGRGSNLLVADAGFDGIVIRLGGSFEEVSIDHDEHRVIAGGMALLPVVARRTAAAGLTGFEWAVGVPGSIGGAVRMNAGGHGSDMAASLVRISSFSTSSGGPLNIPTEALSLGYRTSSIEPDQVILYAELQLRPGDREQSEREISEIVSWRRVHQPGGQNAGSVFANPVGDSAGRLIEEAGLKGFRIGSAEISDKHANFIQADPGGSANDVHSLIREVQRMIKDNAGIELRAENLLIGFDEESTTL